MEAEKLVYSFWGHISILSFACLQPSGNVDRRIEKLLESVIGSARTTAPSLRNFPAILSNPVAFKELISSRIFRTVSRELGASADGSERVRCLQYLCILSSLLEDRLSF